MMASRSPLFYETPMLSWSAYNALLLYDTNSNTIYF
jgi:hypothetical protein